jgi:cytochrome c biogenesis protein CcmG, thiol:disulfide interchange protein DsbE|tara:strand:+ start:2055 stop:2588 length:534 start_codon:yes stop_codon:yes gene_type:complete
MKNKTLIIPAILFFFILFILFYLLLIERKPSELPSVLINKKVPVFKAESLLNDNIFISEKEFKNELTIVNFFATWCKPCLDEHAYLKRLSIGKNLKIIGINYKDDPKKAIKWLKELGNPYYDVLADYDARIGIDWGVYGLPETFIINSKGIIKYRLVGPITEKNYDMFKLKIIETNQ